MNTAWAKKTNVTNFTTAQDSLRCHKFYYSTALTTMSFFLRRHNTHYDVTNFTPTQHSLQLFTAWFFIHGLDALIFGLDYTLNPIIFLLLMLCKVKLNFLFVQFLRLISQKTYTFYKNIHIHISIYTSYKMKQKKQLKQLL